MDGRGHDTEAGDLHADDIPRVEKAGWLHAAPYARGGPGENDVPGPQGDRVADRGDEGGDVDRHLRRGAVLAEFVVHPGAQPERPIIRRGVGGQQPWAGRAECVAPLAPEDLDEDGAPVHFPDEDVSRGHVVGDHVPGDVLQRLVGGDPTPSASYHYGELALVVEFLRLHRPDDWVIRTAERRAGFGEEDRYLGESPFQRGYFVDVRGVVCAHRHDRARAHHRWAESNAVQRHRVGGIEQNFLDPEPQVGQVG